MVAGDSAVTPAEKITFSFGKNWSDFVEVVSEDDVASAIRDIEEFVGDVRDKTVVDIGCGSGIHSLAYIRMGAKSVHAFDYDEHSVSASRKLHARESSPSNWAIQHGSALDTDYLKSLGTFDIVYSWGVLHHTGAMWEAVGNCFALVAPGGVFWVSLYGKTHRYPDELALKRKFNAASGFGKRCMIARRIARQMIRRARRGKNPLGWNERVGRGMNVYHDIVDWLGGLPYETATTDEVVIYARERGFIPERVQTGGAIINFVLSRA